MKGGVLGTTAFSVCAQLCSPLVQGTERSRPQKVLGTCAVSTPKGAHPSNVHRRRSLCHNLGLHLNRVWLLLRGMCEHHACRCMHQQ